MLTRGKIVELAMDEVTNKTRYIHQGQQLGKALDCVGFPYAVFKHCGFEFEYDNTLVESQNHSIQRALEQHLDLTDDPKPGDIMGFVKNGEIFHLGIFISLHLGGSFAHTNDLDGHCVVTSLHNSPFWHRYFKGHFYSIQGLLS